MLESIISILVVLWFIGRFIFPVGGAAIHLLLVIVLVLFLIRIFSNGHKY